MNEAADKALEMKGIERTAATKRGFMTPPYNTQMHLHMHVLSVPLTESGIRRMAFDSDIFVTPDEVAASWGASS